MYTFSGQNCLRTQLKFSTGTKVFKMKNLTLKHIKLDMSTGNKSFVHFKPSVLNIKFNSARHVTTFTYNV